MSTAGKQLGPLRQHIGRAALEALSDRDLLARFAESGDNDAFAVIVQRHGPGVRNLCRRLLGDDSAADDAFQATFVVLARKTKSLRCPEALAAWLFGAARRIALRARRRMRNRQAPLLDVPSTTRDPLAEMSARELLNILDEEISRLPERFRLPLLLCVAEGQSVSEAARALGATPSAIKGRLERGRATLRRRLAARGLALPAALAALLAEPRRSVSAALVEATVAAASSGRVSPAILALAGRALPLRINFKPIWIGILMLGSGVGAALVLKPPPSRELPIPKTPEPVKQETALPAGALNRFGSLTLRGCRGPVAFSPDGKYVAAGGGEAADVVLVFDAQSGRQVKKFHVATTIQQIVFSADGRDLAAVGSGYYANYLWEFESGKLLGRFRGNCAAFASGGEHHKAAELRGQKMAVMTFTQAGQKIGEVELPIADDRAFSLSPAGSFAAGPAENPKGELTVFDLSNNRIVKRLNSPGGPILGAVFDASEKRLIAYNSGGFTVWDWNSAKELFHWSGRAYSTPAFSPDGRQIAWTGDGGRPGSLWMADLPGGKPRQIAPMVYQWPNSPAFSADGKSLAVVTDGGAVQILDGQTGRDRLPLPALTGRVWNVAFTSDRRQVIAGDMLHLLVWNAASGKLLHRLPDDLPDGEQPVKNTIAANQVITFRQTDATVRLRNLTTLREIRRLESKIKPFDKKYGDLFRNGAVTPDGKLAAIEGVTNLVCVFDLTTGKLLSEHPLAGHAMHYRWLNDGQFLAIEREGYERPLVLDPRTGKELPPEKWSAAWSPPGGRWPEWGDKAVVRLRKLNLLDASGQPAFRAASGFVTEVSESEGGRYLAVYGRTGEPNVIDDRNKPTFWLFDLAARRQMGYATLPEAEHFRFFSPDSRLFVTTTLKGEIVVREVATGRERRRFAGHLPGEITSLAFSRDGRTLLSGGADTQVFLWDLIGAGKPGQSLLDSWNALVGDDAAEAQHAIANLIADTNHAVSLLAEKLKPGPIPKSADLAKWGAKLGDADFATREKASAELARAAEYAIPELRKAMTGSSLEQRRRAEKLLRELESNRLGGERLRAVRAVETLERIGSPDARRILRELAKGPAFLRRTIEAKESLRRLHD